MKLLLKLAWRNIWRNKRRSIITLAAVMFAGLFSIAMRGIQLGTYELNYRSAVEQFTGYLQIQKAGYQKNPVLNKNFIFDESLEAKISAVDEVKGFTPRINADGLIGFKDATSGAAIFGVDPQKEKTVTTLLDKVKKGKFFSSDSSNEIVVGAKLLDNLNANLGDTVVILSQGYDGSLGNRKFKITGTIKMGSQEFDAMAVFMGLKTTQSLLGMYGRINVVAINTGDLNVKESLKQSLLYAIDDSTVAVLNWAEVMPELKQLIEFDNVSGIFFLAILIVIVAFGILNTVLMSVTERFREFGVVLAMGMPQKNLVYLVYIETILITVIGLLLGNLLGYAVNYYIIQNPIILSGEFARIYEEYNFLPRIESSLRFSMFMNVSASILIISLASCLYPAYKVYKLEPMKGIRYT